MIDNAQKAVIGLKEGSHSLISPAIRWGNLLFVSGVPAMDMQTRTVVGDDVETQARYVLERIRQLLQAADTTFSAVLKVNAYIINPADFDGWNRVFAEYFPTAPPARTTIVGQLLAPGLLIEIELIAGISAGNSAE